MREGREQEGDVFYLYPSFVLRCFVGDSGTKADNFLEWLLQCGSDKRQNRDM